MLREPQTAAEWADYYELRWRVLRQPWNGKRARADDAQERSAVHLAAWDGERVVGAGRFELMSSEEARVRGMAVEQGCEGRGIGSLILRGLEAHAFGVGVRRMVLDARESALEFYRRNGYRVVERSYVLYGTIFHWRMEKDLGNTD